MTDQIQKYKAAKSAANTAKRGISRKYIAAAVIVLAVISFIGFWEYIAELIPVGSAYTYKLNNSAQRVSRAMKDTVVSCSKNGITGISRSGKEKWYIEASLDKPLISTEGNKAAVSSRKSKTVYTISGNGDYKSIMTEEPVLNVKIAENGSVAVIMDKEHYNGGVAVYNREGVNEFSWWSGQGSLIDAALSENGRKLAVAVLINEDNMLKSNIIYFDIMDKDSRKKVMTCENELVSALRWDGGRLIAVSDVRTRILSAAGEQKAEINYEGGVLNLFDISEKGNLVFVTGSSSLDRNQTVSSYTTGGRKKGSFVFDGEIDMVSTNAGRIVIASGKEIVMSDRKGGRQKKEVCDTDAYECLVFKFGNRVYLDEGNEARLFFIR